MPGMKTLTINGVTYTIRDSSAAPAGYGLGANAVGATGYRQVNHEEADSLGATGIYWFVDNANPFYPDGWNSGTVGLLIHLQHNLNNTVSAKQIFIPYYKCGVSDSSSTDNYVVVERSRRNSSGDWTPIEWRNPPMDLGVEYRTTERYEGQPVYTRLVNYGEATNGSVFSCPSCSKILRYTAVVSNWYVLPYTWGNSTASISYADKLEIGYTGTISGELKVQFWYV